MITTTSRIEDKKPSELILPPTDILEIFFFEELCASYEVDKYLRSPINETSACSVEPLIPEETKVDKIVLSWILFTLSDSLRARIVVACPKSTKEAWSLISDIVKDNKRSRTNTLKAELRSIKLGDQSMESYFQKIDSIVNILTSLDAHVNEEDVVHYALEGLSDTYNQVCGYMHWKDTFPDLKAVCSLLIAEEMRLKSKVLVSPMDSSSHMDFVPGSSNNSRPSSTAQGKSWKPCFNFTKGICRFGDSCRYVHDANACVPNATSGFNKDRGTSENSTNDLLNKLLAQLGKLGKNMSHTSTNIVAPTVSSSISLAQNYSVPIAYYASLSPTAPTGPSAPPGFPMPVQVPLYYTAGLVQSVPAQSTSNPGQATVLPHAFTTGTLQDPSSSAWNMDTGVSSHLNNSTTSLSTMLNSCMYSTVSDFITRRVLLRCDSTRDLYPVTVPFPIPHAFLVSQHTCHQCLGHPGSDVLHHLVSNNVISCNNEKPPILCHAYQLGKHMRLPFVSSNTIVSSCFDIVHSDVWTSPIPSLSGF
ncbi:ribonuclease H-like domain-containing protein [Tanacetum coccineum]